MHAKLVLIIIRIPNDKLSILKMQDYQHQYALIAFSSQAFDLG